MKTGPLPIVGVSMGDPSGIGPEIVARSLMRESIRRICRPVVVGDARTIDGAARAIGVPLRVRSIQHVGDAVFAPDALDVIDLKCVDADRLRIGQIDAMSGDAAFRSVTKLIELAQAGEVDATVTAPIHKAALHQAGHHYPGHTEIFARFTGTTDFTMMLAVGALRVVHVSTHVSLRQACDAVTRPRVAAVIRLAHQACVRLGIPAPRVGVAGLNPHAGDDGLFGDEEQLHIAPAVADAAAMGIRVDGPHPADTFFPRLLGGGYDIGVAMYHDQGHIPAKLRGFAFDGTTNRWTRVDGINVSLGLPIVRVSVDHGTAFDQARLGTAGDASMVQAIEHAALLAESRGTTQTSSQSTGHPR
jgi:4-phospho-D-threonate 3-dehydrogenase / 4-phospho-D-erythronate 3-dehydrogenase